MSPLNLLDSHVELCLRDIWGVTEVARDKDNDVPFRKGEAACYVKVDSQANLVRVFGIAAVDLTASPDLLQEINDINSRLRTAHAVLYGRELVIEQAMHASCVTRAALGQACDHVGLVAADLGPMIAEIFGGKTPLSRPELNAAGQP